MSADHEGIVPTVSVDPVTGAKKQSKLARFDLIPAKALYELAERFGLGPASGRYGDNNWRGGYDWSLSYAALQRHASLFWAGEDYDKDAEKELPGFKGKHVIAIAWHALVLATFMDEQPDKDDRFKPPSKALAEAVKDALSAMRCGELTEPDETPPETKVTGESLVCAKPGCGNGFNFETPCSLCGSKSCSLCGVCCLAKLDGKALEKRMSNPKEGDELACVCCGDRFNFESPCIVCRGKQCLLCFNCCHKVRDRQ